MRKFLTESITFEGCVIGGDKQFLHRTGANNIANGISESDLQSSSLLGQRVRNTGFRLFISRLLSHWPESRVSV